jgi:hypothetical protein
MHQGRIKVKNKTDFYKKLEQVFDHSPKHHIQILLEDFNTKVVRASIFKPTLGNESLDRNSNDNGVRIV